MKKSKVGGICLLAIILTVTIILFFLTPKIAAQVKIDNTNTATTVVASPEKEITQLTSKPIPQKLIDIGWAESHNDQNKIGYNYRYKTVVNEDGTTTKVKYLWSKDIGKYQLNDYYNEASCRKAGFDIYTEAGNTGCALMMYNTLGTAPWKASEYCWSDIEACKAKRGGNYYK